MRFPRALLAASLATGFAGSSMAASPPPLPASALEKAEWFVVIDGQQVGPLTASAVERRMEDGSVSPDALVWRDGMKDWTPVGQTNTFAGRRVDAALKKGKGPTPLDNKFVVAARF